jgi:hypothetical protein
MMRTFATATTILAAAVALLGTALVAEAKGPFRAEVSGGGLPEPITIEGPLPPEIVFWNDAFAAKPPVKAAPAYTVKLMPEQPDGLTGEYPVLMTLTYFPDVDGAPGLLRGDWDGGDRYFQASPEFRTILDEAISGSAAPVMETGDDGVSAVWYIAPSLAAVGLLLAGGLAGRRLFFRHDE